MKALVMKTLWILIESLASLSQDSTIMDVRRVVDVEFVRSPSSHEYTTFYNNKIPVNFGADLQLRNIDFAVGNSSKQLLRINIAGLAEYCISKEQLQDRFGEVWVHSPPSSPAPSALWYRAANVKGRQVLFGFANQAPNCLESVLVRYTQ